MKFASLVRVVLLLGFCASAVLAAPGGDQNEKPWSYPFVARTIIPEQEPNDTCPGQAMACGDEINPAALVTNDQDWYNFYVAASGTLLTIGTDAVGGSSTDTYLELYDVCGGTMIAYDDDGGPGLFSLIANFAAPHAGTYYAKVRGYNGSTVGAYRCFVQCTVPQPPPPNDQCSGAILIDRCTVGTLNGDSFLATNNYDPGIPGPSCTGFTAAGKDVVYKLELQVGDIVHLDYVLPSGDAAFYIVTDCANVSGTCVVGADDTVTGQHEIIDWTFTAAGTYYVILDAYTSAYGGPWTLTYEITCPGATAVCCVGHSCYLIHEVECAAMQGHWHPEWTTCGPPNPCDSYTPSDPKSWGTIKNEYRKP
jgi:hypothetical protein